MTPLQLEVLRAAEEVKSSRPLICSITNYVTANFVANAQLSCGGLAAMLCNVDEVESLVKSLAGVYVNLGTVLPEHREIVLRAAALCADFKRPFVLDPVAAGLGSLRTQILSDLKLYRPHIVRGNASEIIALSRIWGLCGSGEKGKVRGVESADMVDDAQEAAISVAKFTGGAVAVSGPQDLVTDGKEIVRISGGSPIMERVTGCGCSLGGVMAVYACVASPFAAALAASALYKVAGSRAVAKSALPGSFYVNFIDELYSASPEDIVGALK